MSDTVPPSHLNSENASVDLGLSKLRLLFRLVLFVCYTVAMLLWFGVERLIGSKNYGRIPHTYHRGLCRIFGLKVNCHGELFEGGAALYVANHISYVDIFVMGGVLPGFFIAKSEVAGWPVLGWLARCQNTLFFERKGGRAAEQIKVMQQHLHAGKSLILYPEGTSTAGEAVLPFKSSLFKAAELAEHQDHDDITVQAVTIAYTSYRGQPMQQAQRDLYAWYGDMPFASHFAKMLSAKGCEVELHFHKPVKVSEFENRKALAAHCQQQVAGGLLKATT